MSVLRWLVLGCCLAAPASAPGQEPKSDPDKISNDDPARPLQMPPASSETKEAMEDYARFERREAWERALKALYTIGEDQARRFVDGESGFIVTVAEKRRQILAALPADGLAAYRLFYDAEAQKLLKEAEGANELPTLERLYSAYFPTSVGDDAADRLGDLYFELGRFDRAADCWLAVLRERPDTDLSPATLGVKAALALARAGRRSELAEVRKLLDDRYADEVVTLGGRSGTPAEVLAKVLGDAPKPEAKADASASAEEAFGVEGLGEALWQVRFGDSITAGMTPQERTQWDANGISGAVPAVAILDGRLLANYLGYDFAVDLATGKLLWRSGKFHNVDVAANGQFAQMVDTGRYALVAEGDRLWSLGRDPSQQNYFGPFQLTCRRTDTGDVIWKTADLPEYAQLDFNGPPLLAAGKLFLPAKGQSNNQGQPAQLVVAIDPKDGKILWKSEAGLLRQGQTYYYYGQASSDPPPRLLYRAGTLYLDTHQGVLARLEAESGDVDWGFAYPTDAAQMGGGGRFVFIGGFQQFVMDSTTSSPPLFLGDALLIKGAKSDRLTAIDPERMKLLWKRPIAKASRMLGVAGETLYLGGPDLDALDLGGRELLWSNHLPGGSELARVLVRPGGLWQLTPRGVFELDPASGTARTIFRGDDTGSRGGDLYLTDRLLLAVSNRTISAYARPEAPVKAARADTEEATDE
jgi:outer membrane protein assembly factor BamB